MPTEWRARGLCAAVLAVLSGCSAAAENVAAEVSDRMPTVVRVTWTTAEPTRGYVAFGEDSLDRRTAEEAEASTDHEALLVGLAPNTSIRFRIEGDARSRVETVTTDGFDNAFAIDVEGEGNDHFMVLPLLGGDQFPAIIDPQGRVVWVIRDERPLQTFRTRVARDGSGLWFNAVLDGGYAAPGSQLVKVDWEGQEVLVHDVDYLTHDFVELGDGTLVSLAAEFRGEGEDEIEGNRLVAVSPDGTTEDLWSSWDCFDPEAHPSQDPNRPGEWTHGNALDYDRERDAFVVGFRNLGTLAHVDRATGTCAWAFGGAGGDVTVRGPQFRFQHQFHWTDGGMLVFDNQGAQGQVSRVIEYSFDEEAKEAAFEADIRADPAMFTAILGDVHRVANGDLMVAWGAEGVADRFSPEGEHLWRMSMVNDVNLGFTEVLIDPGRPTATE